MKKMIGLGLIVASVLVGGCGKHKDNDGTFKDARDQREYRWVRIGEQVWMSENLGYVPIVSPSRDGSETSHFYYVYDYQGSTLIEAQASSNFTVYGALYNWTAAMKACPTGWHLPTRAEWTSLTDYLGATAGGSMKESGTAHWSDPNAGGDNESGFTALPGGYRDGDGTFKLMGASAGFWSASLFDPLNAFYWQLTCNGDEAKEVSANLSRGYSIRCVKD